MSNKLDVLGFVSVGFTILFCGWGFYWIFANDDENLAAKIGFAAFWLILSFIFVTYSIGISQDEEKTKIRVPKKPAIGVFFIAGVLLAIAIFINGGL
jgi:hypothetical protein